MTQYATIFAEHIKKWTALSAEERRIQSEKENVTDMLKASFAMMSDEERTEFLKAFTDILEEAQKNELGLTEAIRAMLQSNPKEWFHAVKVRENLKASGFDFSGYTSNPLASIHAVLKRFKRTEVKVRKAAAGLREYRWIKKPPSLKSLYGLEPLEPFPAVGTTVPLRTLAGGSGLANPKFGGPPLKVEDEKEKK